MSPQQAARLVWYFDFVSPFSYLQFEAYPELMQTAALRPVLFAGLLNHWGGKGPAEIPAKRLQTYRYTYWQAGEYGIPMNYPPAHPFNPIHALRLAIALDSSYEAVKAIFEFIWEEGRSVADEWPALLARLHLEPAAADAMIAAQRVKDALAANGRQAIDRGVYGVPTFDTGRELFWGLDATDMLLDYLADPTVFDEPEMRRIAELPVGAARKS
ncbi:MAG: 2-hydroxychromene-2-carboxylate isomerase [Burkholderiales bacterium]|nr:2-hydroxychromene-2-carboxylate isomerase [Burkholderiales bacterium]